MKKEVVCDFCQKDFTIKTISERQYKKNGKKYRELWFNCPHCGHRYNVYNGVDKQR